ncbi:glycoside hydrolase family 26 protein [Paenibacillus sp. GCM10023252]|uniref:glycoside hydrolase family 26 protein n=1 Tax=Paenibacillus sp. GCM10023252 TaxID=3252649 RepID=UPI003623F4E1
MKGSIITRIRQRFVFLALAVFILALQAGIAGYIGYNSYHVVDTSDWTIHAELSSYTPAKLEPEQGAYLGAYVLQNAAIGHSMSEYNERTGRTHASFFKYVGYGQPFPAEWVEQVKAEGAFPHIAWEPNGGLLAVKEDEYLRGFAKAADAADVPIFLRFASEMNGSWTSYSGNPQLYKETWKLVHDVFEELAPQVAMVWTVLAMPERTIERYYPGDRYVDWVGVNVYNVKYHNNSKSHRADFEDPLDLINTVYNRFSRTKPIQLSEFGVTHYTVTDGKKDNDFARGKISRLYQSLPKLYPRVKAVFYFDVNNVGEPNPKRRINDYSVTSEQEVLEAYRQSIADEHYLSGLPAEPAYAGTLPLHTHKEHFTYRGRVFKERGVLYADVTFYEQLLGLKVEKQGRHVILTRGAGKAGLAVKTTSKQRRAWAGYHYMNYVPLYRSLTSLPLEDTLQLLGYEVVLNGNNIWIEE